MSIHAHLSEGAQARLNAQKRNSTISSIVISALVVALIFLLLGIFLLPEVLKPTEGLVATIKPPGKDTPIVNPPPSTNQPRSKPVQLPSSFSQVRALAANTLSTVSIPVPDVETVEPSVDYATGESFGPDGIGDVLGGDTQFERITGAYGKRCSKEDRLARLEEQGGTPECEEAVVKALDWLKATQNPDGSWDSAHPVAMTGFALLAYLGHCETPLSEEYGETVLKGITYLVNVGLKNDGKLTNKDLTSIQWVYDHGIATYALAESYTFCSQLNVTIPNLGDVTKSAGDIIMDGQGESGGWVYRFLPTTSGDNSVGFWQIQALKACKHTGLWSDGKFNPTVRKALGWLTKVQGRDGAIGYRSNSSQSPGLTGGGVLAFQMWDEGRSGEARKGIKHIAANTGFKWGDESANLYYHYYNAQAMINHGGREWEDYNNLFRDELIKAQKPDGSWERGGGGNHGAINPHMATCLATLMLEVYYRFLPGTGAR